MIENKFDYELKDIEPYIVGNYEVNDFFSFDIHSNNKLIEGDRILINGEIYEVETAIDDTTDNEFGQGFSYSKIFMVKI